MLNSNLPAIDNLVPQCM